MLKRTTLLEVRDGSEKRRNGGHIGIGVRTSGYFSCYLEQDDSSPPYFYGKQTFLI
jgi:hypothetical protein